MIKLLFFASVFAATYLGVKFFRVWCVKREIYDVPNERSSHRTPVPVGGGLVFGVVCLSALALYCLIFQVEYFISYFAGAVLIIFVSWLDDLYSIKVFWRILLHISAAILVIWQLGFWEKAYIPFAGSMDLGCIGLGLTFIWIVWLINAYNFMDGIDGLAAMQALTAGIGWLVAGFYMGFENVGFYGGVIACAAFAFLLHNWEPAKIFMGDAGSAFLGYTFAVLPLAAARENAREKGLLPLIGAALVFLFLFDSLWTLLRRLVNRERIWEPHRKHIYQKLVIEGRTHNNVTLLYGAISAAVILLLIIWLKYHAAIYETLVLLNFFSILHSF